MTDIIRILHVDDEPDFTDMAATFIERVDDRFDVETATSASEGLDRFTDTDFDCIVSDYDMPGQNGIEFLETVRADNPDLPFILYTGKGSEEIASDAISAGVTDYLQKESGTSQYEVLAHRINNAVEQYRSRRAVTETEQKLSPLAERTEDILFMFDSDWSELLFINSAYEEVWNRSIDELESNPRSFLENVHPEDQDVVEQTLERILEGKPTEVEHRLKDEDGVRWIYSKANPVFDEDGNFTRIIGFVRDITERKEHQQELERKNEQFRYVEDVADIGYWEIDTQTPEPHDVTLSDGVYHIHGLSPDESLDVERGIEFYHPEDRQQVREAVNRAISEGKPYEYEARLITDTGRERWVHSIGEPVERDEEIVNVRGVFQDITVRKEQERELREEQHFIDTALDTLADIFYVISPEGEFRRWNDELSTVTGYSDAEIESMNALEFFEGDDIDRIQSFFEEVIETGEAVVEADLVTKDGESIPYSSRASQLRDPDGEVIGITGISRDISDQKKREGRLQQQNERLEEFARIVSHDLRNPLTVAQGRLELVREDQESEDLEAISRAHERMSVLIEDLLTLAREGKTAREVEQVNLDTLAQECWETVDRADARLDADSGLLLEADRSRLKQLIENLLRNAIEHGGDDVTLSLGDLETGFYLEDDGPGIPESIRDDVFSAGFTTSQEGTGYGLSIVKEVVEAHGWNIQINESSEGGARFEITGVESTQFDS